MVGFKCFNRLKILKYSMATPKEKEPEKQEAYVGDVPSNAANYLNDLDEFLVRAY